ncbi:MAG: T9SS type A sorting domain-containing protein [Bacteroidales bacterium]|nr:T9SS type A sorting domain-containing protein [Bacteroidales bacterium]
MITKKLTKPFLIFSLILFEGFSFSLMAQQTLPPQVDSVVVTFNNIPTQVNVGKAPLKYNKAFAMSFQEDDALSDIYNLIYPVFQGSNGTNGLYYTDGCGDKVSFKMSSAIFIFTSNGTDILDPNNPYHDNTKLTWPELKTLYQNHWGINNHGLFDNPDISSPGIINYAFQKTKSYTRRMISDSMTIKSFVIPNNVVNYVDYLGQNEYHSAINQGQDNTWIGYGKNGFNVESDTINWLKPVKLCRDFIYDGFRTMADTLYKASLKGEHRWFLSGMHQMPGGFLTDMTSIYQKYGAPGLDDILITTDDDLLDYFAVKQVTQLHESLKGNRLVITFSGEVPTDLLHYAMSLNVNANESIQNIKVYGAKQYSYNGINRDTALINFSWEGRIYKTPEFLADSFTNVAMKNSSEWDALVAMDYVLKMPQGDAQIKLRKELCSIDQSGWKYQYDKGFCGFPDLGSDTTICSGNCLTYSGPAGMTNYQWLAGDSLFSQAESVKVCPKAPAKYFLTVKNLEGQIETDSVWVNVLPTPSVELGNDTTLLSLDTLTFKAPSGNNYTYLWNTGDTREFLTLDTKWDTLYKVSVTVTNQAGCSAKDSIQVTVPPKDSIPEISALQDTVFSCNGDTVTLKVSSNTNQIYWLSANHEIMTDSGALKLVPTQSGKFYIKACNKYGCSSQDSIYVLMEILPVINISRDTSVCFGDSAFLNVSGGKFVQWFDKNVSLSKESEIGIMPQKTTTYLAETWNRSGCVSSDSVKVIINSLPTTKINYDTNRVCKGALVGLTASGADNYQWMPEGKKTPSLAITVNDTMRVILTGTSNMGCISKDSVELYPLSLPKTKILYDANKVCKGTVVDLKASGANSYLWSPVNDTTNKLPVRVIDTVEIKLIGINEAGCIASDSVNLIPLPIPDIKIIYDTNHVCLGTNLVLKANGASTYEWYPKQVAGTTLPLTVNGTKKINLIGRSKEGCIASDSVELYPIAVPATKILYDTSRVCQGTQIILTASGADNYLWFPMDSSGIKLPVTIDNSMKINLIGFNKSGCSSVDSVELSPYLKPKVDFSGLSSFYCMNELPVTLTGSPSGGIFSGDGLTDNIFSPSNAGTGKHYITYFYTTKEGCSAKTVKTTMVSNLVPIIKLTPADTTLKRNGFVSYDAGQGFSHYYWTTGDTTRKIQVNYNNAFSGTDTIRVEGLVGNCISVGSAILRFGQLTGLPANKVKLATAFPNPSKGQFYVEYSLSDSPSMIKVFNVSGKAIFQKELQKIPINRKVRFNLTGIKAGMYFVCFYGKTEATVAKVIIQ